MALFPRLSMFLLSALLLAGCAAKPLFELSGVDGSITPDRAVNHPQNSLGKRVLWGGTILQLHNLQQGTQVEVLAYPLDDYHRPLPDREPMGRFLVRHPGFLEPLVYAQGRQLTVLGEVGDSQTGKVGESSYRYPVILAHQLQLWPEQRGFGRTRFHFGIGIRL